MMENFQVCRGFGREITNEWRLRNVGKNIWSRHLGVALCDTKMADKTWRLKMIEFFDNFYYIYWNIIRIDILNVFEDEKRSSSEMILIFIAASIIVTILLQLLTMLLLQLLQYCVTQIQRS